MWRLRPIRDIDRFEVTFKLDGKLPLAPRLAIAEEGHYSDAIGKRAWFSLAKSIASR